MTYKQFVAWCNERACDGIWGRGFAIECALLISQINKLPFWKRQKAFEKVVEDSPRLLPKIEELNHVVNKGEKQ